MSKQQSPQRERNGVSESAARGSALLITNLTKMTGLVVAVLEWAQKGPAQDSVLLLCAAMIFGAETLERVAMQAIDRLFGRDG